MPSADFSFKLCVAAICMYPGQVSIWKRQSLVSLSGAFFLVESIVIPRSSDEISVGFGADFIL